jgi:pimeloyl-ACP methyl ester carboxylesterase/class 3 adenylate cyclase
MSSIPATERYRRASCGGLAMSGNCGEWSGAKCVMRGVVIQHRLSDCRRGCFDLVWVPGAVSNVELLAESPPRSDFSRAQKAFFERLGRFARVLVFDKRGTGASDRVSGVASLETRMDDVRAVMDAAGSTRAAVVGVSEGGPLSLLFSATYPERAAALVVYGATPRSVWAPDWPWGEQVDEYMRETEQWARTWGTEQSAREILEAVEQATTTEAVRRHASWQRLSASPGDLIMLERMNVEIDVRHVLPVIHVPTLVLHRSGDEPVEPARWMAAQIPGARFVEAPGHVHIPYFGDSEFLLCEIEDFLTGIHEVGGWAPPEPERVLATVLFTDIVGSTETALNLGDRRWGEVQQHHAAIRHQLARFRGRELDTAGDGFFAAFDGPARGIRCACAITDAVRGLGLEVRTGLHTGECEAIDGKVGGIAVHIGARVAAQAHAGEVLVSSTVRDLVAGPGIAFHDRGTATLKGIGEEWRLYAVDQVE